MREYWANVWATGNGYGDIGYERPSREECDQYLAIRPNYRIHVRLKPEGAPKRYASEANRRAWEESPDEMRRAKEIREKAAIRKRALWSAGF